MKSTYNSTPGLAQIACIATLCFSAVFSAPAQSYVTNLDAAFSLAKKENRTVVLYTGRSVFCQGKTPREFFFNSITRQYPEFGARSNRYIICEQFMFAPNGPTREFFREYDKYKYLYDRYPLNVFYPSLTFLDQTGHMLNGPFWSIVACDDWFHSTTDEHYSTLTNYFADDPPLNMDMAESNLVAAAFSAGAKEDVFGLFRSVHDKYGGQPERVLESGLPSREYEVGAPFKFSVRTTCIKRETFDHWYEETSVFVIGRFLSPETLSGQFLVRLNGAWFRTCMFPFEGLYPYDWQRRVGFQIQAGEYYFILQTRSDTVGRALHDKMLRLKDSSQ